MKLEHVAIDVADAEAFRAWWCANLGLRPSAPGSAFLLDDSGSVALEVYRTGETPAAPDYAAMNAMTMHVAFLSDDVRADAARLEAAGGRIEKLQTGDPAFHMAIVRDPWGVAIQLVRRAAGVLGR